MVSDVRNGALSVWPDFGMEGWLAASLPQASCGAACKFDPLSGVIGV